MALHAARLLAALSLLALPGAWLAFGLPLRQFSFYSRLALAGVLSPIVVALEFYVARWAGLSFASTVYIIAVVNAGSIWLLVREWRASVPVHNWFNWSLASNSAVLLFLLALISFPWFFNRALRIFNFHVWLHLSIVNQFPAGALVPEEPQLAGFRLAYPWLGHVFWAVLGQAAGWPFTRIYVLTNVALLVWTGILVYEACKALGAPPAGGRAALIWLTLGTNVVGFWLWKLTGHLPGDIRYTPWIRKFSTCELSAFWIAMFAGLVLAGVTALRTRARPVYVLTIVLTASIGLIYAPILPAAAGYVGAIALVLALARQPDVAESSARRDAVWVAAGLLLTLVVCVAFVSYVAEARAVSPVFLSSPKAMLAKAGSGVIAIAPLLLGIAFVPQKTWRRAEAVALLIAAGVCFLCRTMFQVTGTYNEYKFMFPLTLLLAPMASLAMERWKSKRVSPEWLVLASALLLFPIVSAKAYRWELNRLASAPQVLESGSSLLLSPQEPQSGWVSTVLSGSPPNTALAIRHSEIFLPVLLDRPLLGPSVEKLAPPGYWIAGRFDLVGIRGYPPAIVDSRQALLSSLFESGEHLPYDEVYSQLLALKRPVALIFQAGDATGFLTWLQARQRGKPIYEDSRGTSVWLIASEETRFR